MKKGKTYFIIGEFDDDRYDEYDEKAQALSDVVTGLDCALVTFTDEFTLEMMAAKVQDIAKEASGDVEVRHHETQDLHSILIKTDGSQVASMTFIAIKRQIESIEDLAGLVKRKARL